MQAELMGTFGPRLREVLAEVGMTQNELERRAGLSKGAVSNYISERREQPRRDTLKKMAEALGVPLSRLAEDEPGARAPGGRNESGEVDLAAPRRAAGANANPAADRYPARYRALLATGDRFDARTVQWVRSLEGADYEAFDEARWVEEAKRVEAQIRAWDRELPGPAGEGGAARGKASALGLG